jgi:hypothetical protein
MYPRTPVLSEYFVLLCRGLCGCEKLAEKAHEKSSAVKGASSSTPLHLRILSYEQRTFVQGRLISTVNMCKAIATIGLGSSPARDVIRVPCQPPSQTRAALSIALHGQKWV